MSAVGVDDVEEFAGEVETPEFIEDDSLDVVEHARSDFVAGFVVGVDVVFMGVVFRVAAMKGNEEHGCFLRSRESLERF